MTPQEISEMLDKMKQRVFESAIEIGEELGVPSIFMPQAVAMAAATMLLNIHDDFPDGKNIARTQAINSIGGAVQTMQLNGIDLPPYGNDSKSSTSVNVYIPPKHMDS